MLHFLRTLAFALAVSPLSFAEIYLPTGAKDAPLIVLEKERKTINVSVATLRDAARTTLARELDTLLRDPQPNWQNTFRVLKTFTVDQEEFNKKIQKGIEQSIPSALQSPALIKEYNAKAALIWKYKGNSYVPVAADKFGFYPLPTVPPVRVADTRIPSNANDAQARYIAKLIREEQDAAEKFNKAILDVYSEMAKAKSEIIDIIADEKAQSELLRSIGPMITENFIGALDDKTQASPAELAVRISDKLKTSSGVRLTEKETERLKAVFLPLALQGAKAGR